MSTNPALPAGKPKVFGSKRGYFLIAFAGAACATLSVAAATHLTAALAIIALFGVMTAIWAVAHLTDGVALLTIYLFLLTVVPASLSVSGLKSVGAPSFLVAGGIGVWWIFERILPTSPVRGGARPVHGLICLYALSWFLSYAVAQGEVHLGSEARSMDRSLMVVVGWAGIALTAIDGTPTRERLHVLGRRVVYFGGYIALVAILQAQNVYDLTAFHLPGLSAQGDGSSTYDVRSGFQRIKSTTLHPIELATVLGVVLPLALHFLVFARTRRERWAAGVCTALVGAAMPMAVTRTGVLTFAVALLVLIPAWPRLWRKKFVYFAIPGVVFLRLAQPGLLGTLKSLFTSAGEDPSVTGRTDDYPVIFDLIGHHGLFGIGPGTFSPTKYFYLDNQFLGTLVELGGFGAVVMVALFFGAPIVAGQAGRLGDGSDEGRLLARSLSAGLLAGFSTFFTFDTLGFPVVSGLLFLYIGMIGALYRLNVHGDAPPEQATDVPRRRHRRRALVATP